MDVRLQGGASITESLALALVLVPMFMVIVTMGKIADFNSSTTQAVRFATWESAILGQAAYVSGTAEERINSWIMSRDHEGITTLVEQKTPEKRNNVWDLHYRFGSGGEGRLYNSENTQGIALQQYNQAVPNSAPKVLMNSLDTTIDIVESLSDGKFDVNYESFLRTNLNLSMNTAGLLDGANCSGQEGSQDSGEISAVPASGETKLFCVKRRSAILTDAWAAAGPQDVSRRAGGMVNTIWSEPVKPIMHFIGSLEVAGGLGLYKEAKNFAKDVGRIQVDDMPVDRLGEKR